MEMELTGTTKKGKQIVKNRGSIWSVNTITPTVLFSGDDGPWALIEAGGDIRWVHMTSDPNFEIERI